LDDHEERTLYHRDVGDVVIVLRTAPGDNIGLPRDLNGVRLRSAREAGMRQSEPGRIRRPRADDQLMRDILFGISGYAAVLVAHDLKLYPLLAATST
jgi:hypothetical protein